MIRFALPRVKALIAMSLAVALSGTLLTGCVSTPVQPLSFNDLGKVEQFQLNSNTFKLNFTTSLNAPNIDAGEVALLHAAILTEQQHFKYFSVLDEKTTQTAVVRPLAIVPAFQLGLSLGDRYPYRYHRSPFFGVPLYAYGGWYGFDSPYGFDGIYNHEYMIDSTNGKVSFTIECANDNPQNKRFDAHMIIGSLGRKYGVSYAQSTQTPNASVETTPAIAP